MTTGEPSPSLIQTLRDPAAYPWQPESVELIETHISWVFLAGDFVVKIERPVRFGFIDHSRIEQRLHSCREEIRLNRRLTDGIYLKVVPITRSGDRLFVSGEGERFDWAVLMKRLPATRMLDRLLEISAPQEDLAELIAEPLIAFHRGASTCDPLNEGSFAIQQSIVTSNLDELGELARPDNGLALIQLVADQIRALLEVNQGVLQSRVDDGWIREGHGDLRAEHICVEESGRIQIFDCVEFSRDIRCADVASDLAFLLMDLERLGAGELARRIVALYQQAGFDLPDQLLRMYLAHRALVRAKVELLTRSGDSRPDVSNLLQRIRYASLATKSLFEVTPFLAVMTGLSGTGKSTIAKLIAQFTGVQILSSDQIRKELAGIKGSATSEWSEGIYNSQLTERTYRELIFRAREVLLEGGTVILDATFLDERWRGEAGRLANDLSIPLLVIETIAEEATTTNRIMNRIASGQSLSDATQDIYHRQRELVARHPPGLPERAIRLIVDTSPDKGDLLGTLVNGLRTAGLLIPRA